MKTEKTCANCQWYEVLDDGSGACTNDDSPSWAEFTAPDDSCEAWEEITDESH